jgi:hypothetical protein
MDIGEPQRTIVVEPIEYPVPADLRPAIASRLAAPDLAEPVVGWRLWSLARARDGAARLSSATREVEWPVRRALDASCRCGLAPAAGCGCGIHALRTPDGLFRCLGADVAPPSPYVVGLVGLWGRVVECERGWRAEFAYPLRLYAAVSGESRDRADEGLAAALAAYGCEVEVLRGGVRTVLAALAPHEVPLSRFRSAR